MELEAKVDNDTKISFKSIRKERRKENVQEFFRKFFKNKIAVVGGIIVSFYIFVALFAPFLAPFDPDAINLDNKLQGPTLENWMGTDDKGRDIMSRVIYGSRLSMGVGFAAVSFGAFFGIIMGLIAGYYGGVVDSIISRLLDVMLAFPGILLALAIISALGPSLFNVMVAVGVFSVPLFARIARGSTMEVRNLEYIDAVRTLGAHDGIIIFRHIFPNILSPLI